MLQCTYDWDAGSKLCERIKPVSQYMFDITLVSSFHDMWMCLGYCVLSLPAHPFPFYGIIGSSDFTFVDIDPALEDHLDVLGFDWSFREWD